MKKMMFLCKNWYFSVQKALIYYTVNKSHHNSFILLVFSHVANFIYVANFRFLTLTLLFESSTCCSTESKDTSLHLSFLILIISMTIYSRIEKLVSV